MRTWFSTCAVALSLAAALAGCSNRRAKSEPAPGPRVPDQAAIVPATPEKPAEPAIQGDRAADKKAKLRLTLRSTPSGATAAVDGREVGRTPLVHEMDADGQVHQFTFVLAGHAMERYRFPPVRDGVVHATLRPIEQPDAGPK
jgi:hypothetical protein